jgi:hypothetical protein
MSTALKRQNARFDAWATAQAAPRPITNKAVAVANPPVAMPPATKEQLAQVARHVQIILDGRQFKTYRRRLPRR